MPRADISRSEGSHHPVGKFESLLVADVGSVHTRVGLVDRVAGEFRFVGMGISPTTMEPPTTDVMVGVRRAIQQLEARIHRQLLNDEAELVTPERADGQGVDAFAAVTSAPLPLRVAIIGLAREVSVASAMCAVRSTYTTIEATLALDDTGGRWLSTNAASTNPNKPGPHNKNYQSRALGDSNVAPATDPAVLAAEALARVDCEVIVLVGGIDGGATSALYELANLVAAITASREPSTRPIVIFAGNRDARSQVAAQMGDMATLRIVDNVHPALERENPTPLARELETLYTERKLARLPGLGKVNNWAKAPVIQTAQAFERVVRFLSRARESNVIGADIGATSTVVVSARGAGSRDGAQFTRGVNSELGMGYSLGRMLQRIGSQPFLDWLPLESTEEEFKTNYLNQALRPGTIPATREEARYLHSAARQALATAARDARIEGREADWILLTGGMFSFNSDYGALALVALDALQPQGVMRLAVDTTGLAPAFGALAALDAHAAANVISRDAFVPLGTVVAPESLREGARSGGHEGQVDLHVRLQTPGSGEISLEVNHGTLEVIPLAPGQKAQVQIRTAKGVELRNARNGLFEGEVEGGVLGLVIDARGRPLALPEDPERRRAKVQQWYWDVGS